MVAVASGRGVEEGRAVRGYLRCMGQDVRDWRGETPVAFFAGCMDAVLWALEWNRSGLGGTYVRVEVVALVGEGADPVRAGPRRGDGRRPGRVRRTVRRDPVPL